MLLIDHDSLVPYERNYRNFIDFDKPTVFEMNRLIVYGTFKSTIILKYFLDAKVWYFLRYNEKMQISFFKKIDFSVYAKNAIGIYRGCLVPIVPRIGKMFLMTWLNLILVFDMSNFQVSQVLENTLPYLFTWWNFQVFKTR